MSTVETTEMTSPTPPNPGASKIRSVPPPVRSVLTREVLEDHLEADVADPRNSIRRGGNWFYWVAGLSVVNSIIALSGGHVTFLAGLALSQIADAYAAHLGFVGPYFSIEIAVVIAVFLCGFGYLASHGSRAALITGMILYALDGVVFLLFSAYLPALFHGYVLFRMAQEWKARTRLERFQAESAALAATRPGPASPAV